VKISSSASSVLALFCSSLTSSSVFSLLSLASVVGVTASSAATGNAAIDKIIQMLGDMEARGKKEKRKRLSHLLLLALGVITHRLKKQLISRPHLMPSLNSKLKSSKLKHRLLKHKMQ